MPYPVENALFQWRDGERRIRDSSELERADLEVAVGAVLDELRRRLGSRFIVEELADFYASGTDWAAELAARYGAGIDAPHVVDAAFSRYARQASNHGGGITRETHSRP